MSYILDALNRSEQERKGSKTPDLGTIHRTAPVAAKSNRGLLWIGLIVLVLNGAGLAYFLNRPAIDTVDEVQGLEPETAEPASTSASQTFGTTIPIQSNTAPSATRELDHASIYPIESEKPPAARPVRITELPINVQRRVPNMVFSSHLYSDQSDFRMVNINGRMIREGDMLANDIRLIEITEEGVVLSYLHYVFEVSVLRDWSFN